VFYPEKRINTVIYSFFLVFSAIVSLVQLAIMNIPGIAAWAIVFRKGQHILTAHCGSFRIPPGASMLQSLYWFRHGTQLPGTYSPPRWPAG
jgi:hypothetical protein